jgi:transposase-like protein
MAKVISGTRQRVTVKKTGHPAAFRKVRCPACKQGYAVASNIDPSVYACDRCGRQFKRQGL